MDNLKKKKNLLNRWDVTEHFLRSLEGPIVGVEVGVWKGETSEHLLRKFPNLFLHLVDPWKKQGYIQTLRRVEKYIPDRCAIHRMTSVAAAEKGVVKGEVDFVFIDAVHTYKDLKEDLAAWKGYLKPLGTIFAHDYAFRFPGVVEAVDEFISENGMQFRFPDDLATFTKGIPKWK